MNKEMENTINQQLLPCPFCGGKPVIRKSRRFIPARFDKSVIIRCSVCDTKTAGLQLNKAVASWNKRTEKCEEPVEVVSMQPIKQKPEIAVSRRTSPSWDSAKIHTMHSAGQKIVVSKT